MQSGDGRREEVRRGNVCCFACLFFVLCCVVCSAASPTVDVGWMRSLEVVVYRFRSLFGCGEVSARLLLSLCGCAAQAAPSRSTPLNHVRSFVESGSGRGKKKE